MKQFKKSVGVKNVYVYLPFIHQLRNREDKLLWSITVTLNTLSFYLYMIISLLLYPAAKIGLTENELEDILACDDDVLNDVYVYWTPPIRRLPPLLIVRLRQDIQQYLGLCLSNVVQVTTGYSAIFRFVFIKCCFCCCYFFVDNFY